MTRLDLQKFYYDLNENVINASKTLIDSAWEVNLNLSSGIIPFSKASDSDQVHLSAIRYNIILLV